MTKGNIETRTSSKELSRRLFEDYAQLQRGHFTARQAREAGYHESAFFRFSQDGSWQKIRRNIYRLENYPEQDYEDLAVFSLWSHDRDGSPQGVISYESALEFYGLSDLEPYSVHLTVPKTFRRSAEAPDGIEIHYGDLSARDIRMDSDFSVTTPLRAFVDVLVSGAYDESQVVLALTQAVDKGLITSADARNATLTANELLAVTSYFDDIIKPGRINELSQYKTSDGVLSHLHNINESLKTLTPQKNEAASRGRPRKTKKDMNEVSP